MKDYLEVRGLTVDFDGFKAVDGVDLTLLHGDLRFLIGPNGAGKTTLVDAITGLVQATGSARFGGHELLGRKVHQIARLGVGRTFQTATVFEQLTCCRTSTSPRAQPRRADAAAPPAGRARRGGGRWRRSG